MTDPAPSLDPIKTRLSLPQEARGRMPVYQVVVKSGDHEEDRALVTTA
jgi:hypothetical protein